MFGRSHRSAWTTGILTAGVATGLLGTAIPANAVVGAAVTDASYAFTANLQIGEGEQMRACSGALIDASWVLTAAACFAPDPLAGGEVKVGKPALKTVATIGRNDLAGTGGHVSEVVEVIPRGTGGSALVRLATPATGITPVPVATTPAAAGQTLKSAGFGRSRTEWRPDKLHAATFGVDSVDAGTVALTGATADDAICAGDTGGPVLRQRTGGGVELVGVSTRSWQGGCFGMPETETRTGAVAARVDGFAFRSQLAAGQRLQPGDVLVSATARLTMQADGDLVVSGRAGNVLWSTGTAGNPGATAVLGADGNLVVRNAADTTTLWQSGTSAAGGSLVVQDRGNVVVRTSTGATVWSSGTAIRNDVDLDGRSDMTAWYDFAEGTDATYTFGGQADGRIGAFTKTYASKAGEWRAEYQKRVTGDFTGDGRSDLVFVEGYSDTSVKMFLATAKADGMFAQPVQVWAVAAGHTTFHYSNMTPQAGDFNGDGREDVALWNVDKTTGVTRLFTFTANATGGFNRMVESEWSAPAGTWTRARAKFVTGDFNGDGRDELGVFYGQGDNTIKQYVFPTTAAGVFTAPQVWWTGPAATTYDWNKAQPHVGDFNGDRLDDLMFWYDNGKVTGNTLLSTKTAFGPTVKLSLSGDLDTSSLQLVVGDYDGDGRDDLGAMYHYASTGVVKMWTWTAKPDAGFNGALLGWESKPNSFLYAQTQFVKPYSG
ncbi:MULTISPECIES: FG-GAP-like repeat-containing protein [Streptomyces]|uniref:FG-GAP-like repeat-containing protein n=1 Tax=Streptomyces changanensis TaxID=2964669 RepID=A0ABY5N726_9ACTN|nr:MULTISPECIES: FG-GAP-like repeat-containing protein [Streptomyces]UUS31728.1 FG-GAP-like repeat-containing protein [Streptomyces changanensis]